MNIVLIARVILGAYFAITGLLKLPDLKGFVKLVRRFGGLSAKYPFLAYLMPFGELVVGIPLLIGWQLKLFSVLALIMCLVYLYGVSSALIARKKLENCGCLGTMVKIPLGWFTLVEDIVCLALSVIIVLSTYGFI